MSQHQKQQILNTLTTYLSGNENLKKVINSPALDRHGKMLSRDGQKIFTASNNFHNRGNGRFNNKRGRGDQNGRNKKKGNQKRKHNGNEVIYTHADQYNIDFEFRSVVNPAKEATIAVTIGAGFISPVAVIALVIVS